LTLPAPPKAIMRFLQRNGRGGLELTSNIVGNIPKYAILSHTWLADDQEVTYEDLINQTSHLKPESHTKIQFCAEQATKDGLDYFWVDTCCIDKSSSAELQEALTSMFQWYRNATRCYVYLRDVSISADEANVQRCPYPWESAFRQSKWFTRGWTLQELIAPPSVEFFSVQGTRLGDKNSLEQRISDVTGIPHRALRGDDLDGFTVDERLLWAQNRQTKRQEDRAYCLMGMFAVFMPLLYGEGEQAFARLMEGIKKKLADRAKLDGLITALPIAPQAAFDSPENHHRQACLPNTRLMLLHSIAEWADGLHERCIFWLSGKAGTGKSTVARTVAKIHADRGNLGASFFFSRGGGDVGHADRVVLTLAVQLATRIPAVRPHICEAIQENKGIASSSLRDQWDQLIINPLLKLDCNSQPSAVVFVIDALDECASERDIRVFLRLLALFRSPSNVRLRIFITSRPESPIQIGFSHIPQAKRQVYDLHDVARSIVDGDLYLYFRHCFKNIREERGFAADWPGTPIIRRLVGSSRGSFSWASTACRFIRDGKRQGRRRISILTENICLEADPDKQLDEIYLTVLKDTIEQGYTVEEKQGLYELLRKVLGSIVVLFSPLSMNSLANLLHLRPGDIHETLADLHTLFNIPSQMKRPIRLHHPTFRDFLLNKDRCSDPSFWVDEKQAHKALADNCVDLMSQMLRRDMCGFLSAGTLAKDVNPDLIEQCIPPELQYACIYWVHHYRQSGARLRDGDRAHIFFKKYYLFWLEAMSLLDKSSEMAAMIRMYQSLLLVRIAPINGRSQLTIFISAC
jgi:hypothetical protein